MRLRMGGTGLEHVDNSRGKTVGVQTNGAKSGAILGACDADLALIVQRWPMAPEAKRRRILSMVRDSDAID
jgi:hypothetical protein